MLELLEVHISIYLWKYDPPKATNIAVLQRFSEQHFQPLLQLKNTTENLVYKTHYDECYIYSNGIVKEAIVLKPCFRKGAAFCPHHLRLGQPALRHFAGRPRHGVDRSRQSWI